MYYIFIIIVYKSEFLKRRQRRTSFTDGVWIHKVNQ